MKLAPCPACRRHVFVTDVRCPFCDAALSERAGEPRGPGRALGPATVLAATLALAGCDQAREERPSPVYGAPPNPVSASSGGATSAPSGSSAPTSGPTAGTGATSEPVPTASASAAPDATGAPAASGSSTLAPTPTTSTTAKPSPTPVPTPTTQPRPKPAYGAPPRPGDPFKKLP